jgi:hypothetical protein
LIRLAWFCVTDHGFTPFSAVVGPKSDPSFFVDPLSFSQPFRRSMSVAELR